MYESASLTFMVPRISGWLSKKCQGRFGQYHRFWFVLTGGTLYYFIGPASQDPRAIILLEAVTVSQGKGRSGRDRRRVGTQPYNSPSSFPPPLSFPHTPHQAIKGSSPTELILYSNFNEVIKSVKISKAEKTMVQGTHKRYLLRASSREERDEWLEALQIESTAPVHRQHRAGSNTATSYSTVTATTTIRSGGATTTSSGSSGSSGSSPSKTLGGGLTQTCRTPRSAGGMYGDTTKLCTYTCLVEGWMWRRNVSRAWQRRYFMLLTVEKAKKQQDQKRTTELFWFTTKEMSERMYELGVPTAQGSVVLGEHTTFYVRSPQAVAPYRLPETDATVFEIESLAPGGASPKTKELISPEDKENLACWIEALHPLVTMLKAGSNRERY